MIDLGKINEAENILLDSIDYTNNNEVIEVALFYQYLSEKDNKFLENNNYTKEEVLSGFKVREDDTSGAVKETPLASIIKPLSVAVLVPRFVVTPMMLPEALPSNSISPSK